MHLDNNLTSKSHYGFVPTIMIFKVLHLCILENWDLLNKNRSCAEFGSVSGACLSQGDPAHSAWPCTLNGWVFLDRKQKA